MWIFEKFRAKVKARPRICAWLVRGGKQNASASATENKNCPEIFIALGTGWPLSTFFKNSTEQIVSSARVRLSNVFAFLYLHYACLDSAASKTFWSLG